MRRRLRWLVLLSAALVVTVLFNARPAMATPPDKFTSSTLALGRFGEINALNQFIPPANQGNIWLSRQKTKGLSDGYVLSNDPGAQHEPR